MHQHVITVLFCTIAIGPVYADERRDRISILSSVPRVSVFARSSSEGRNYPLPNERDRIRRWWTSSDKHYDPPSISCAVGPTVTAPARSTSARVTWSEPSGASRISGPASGSVLQEGTHTVTYKKTAHDLSSSCSVAITVRVVRCPTPAAPLHGSRSCTTTQGRMVYGDHCTFSCGTNKSGFYMAGSSTSSCSTAAKMTSPVPSCKPVPCGNPANISNGHFICNGNTYGSACHVACDDGYTIDMAARSIRCQADRHWSSTRGCLDLKPPLFQHCPSSKIYFAERGGVSAVVTWGKVTAIDPPTPFIPKVTQTRGPKPGSSVSEGHYHVEFEALDAANNSAVHPCKFNITVHVIRCKTPHLDNTTLLQYKCDADHVYGSECHVTCRHGDLAGPKNIVCEKDGSFPPQANWTWDQSFRMKPYCQVRACPVLPSPRGGAMSCDDWQHGTLCQMQCQRGYTFPARAPKSGIYKCDGNLPIWFPNSPVPDCLATKTFFSISMAATFYYGGHCDQNNSHEVRQNFIAALRTFMFGIEMCKVVQACEIRNVHVTCGSGITRKHQEEMVKVKVVFRFAYGFLGNNNSATYILMVKNSFVRKMKSLGDVGLLNLRAQGLKFDKKMASFGEVTPECQEGLREVNGSCAGCGPGYVVNKVLGSCTPCPVGYFQDQDSAFWCQPCPLEHTTEHAASSSFQDCKTECSPGQYSETGLSPCFACPTGFYQPQPRSKDCLRCPPGMLSRIERAESVQQCQEYDVLISPHGKAVFKAFSRDMDQWSYSVWFKLREANGGQAMLGLWASEDEHELVYISLTNVTLHVYIHGNQTVSKTVTLRPTWNHFVLTASSHTGVAEVFANGLSVMRINRSRTSSLSLPRNSRMHIMADDAGVSIAGLTVRDYVLNKAEVEHLTMSCDAGGTSRDLGLDSVDHDISVGVDVIFPSACNA